MKLNPYSWIMKLRSHLYLKEISKSQEFEIPIISIGNINTGGSGKTPFIQFLVHQIEQISPGLKILIISKSYKAKLKRPTELTRDVVDQPELFGDEACLLKMTTHASVWSGPIKSETLKAALSLKKYDICIIDDGFSHLKIKRDLDIVLFDASRSVDHYTLLPIGRMREDWSALSRADLVILTKIENQDQKKIEIFKEKIKANNPNIFTAHYETLIPKNLNQIFLLSAIGHPEVLFNQIKNQGLNIVQHLNYPDHYSYPLSEQEKIMNLFLKADQGTQLLTTQKDFVKFKNNELKKVAQIVELNVSMNSQALRYLHEKIRQIL